MVSEDEATESVTLRIIGTRCRGIAPGAQGERTSIGRTSMFRLQTTATSPLASSRLPAACDTDTSIKAPVQEMRAEPFRVPPEFACTLNRATPLPLPGLPDTSTMNADWEEAVHVQPIPVDTLTSIVAPRAETLVNDVGDTV